MSSRVPHIGQTCVNIRLMGRLIGKLDTLIIII